MRSHVPPQREFLRIITTRERSDAEKAKQRLAAGEAFFTVARELSVDSSASVGGYAGEKWLAKLDAKFATTAASLQHGQTSGIIGVGDRWLLLQRVQRDFKWDADQLLQQAKDLAARGDREGALEKCRQALRIYPSFLRALRFSGMLFVETGDIRRGVYVLQGATRLYPEDAGAQFDLALVLGHLGRHADEIQAYRRAIELGPDLVSAYMNLGQALSSTGDGRSAIGVIRQGLQINPLSAELYFALSRLLAQAGDAPGADQAMALAKKIDPALVQGLSK
jgi:tetratricopeptide (TPR) repeat protein